MYLKSINKATLMNGMELLKAAPNEVVMVLVAEKSADSVNLLIRLLNKMGISFFGGIFPAIIHGSHRIYEGCILKKFSSDAAPILIRNISSKSLIGLRPIFVQPKAQTNQTAILLFDGRSSNISYFLEEIHNQMHEPVGFIGGGAGFSKTGYSKCVFSNQGLFNDAAICCVVNGDTNGKVWHGWDQLAGPFIATQTDGTNILQMNWRNAFQVFKEQLQEKEGVLINKVNFLQYVNDYTFGILQDNQENLVRSPIALSKQGAITFAADIPPYSVLYLLKSHTEQMPNKVAKSLTDWIKKLNENYPSRDTFIVDSSTSQAAPNSDFSNGKNKDWFLMDTGNSGKKPYGILSLGGISSNNGGLPEFFNRSIAIGSLEP